MYIINGIKSKGNQDCYYVIDGHIRRFKPRTVKSLSETPSNVSVKLFSSASFIFKLQTITTIDFLIFLL